MNIGNLIYAVAGLLIVAAIFLMRKQIMPSVLHGIPSVYRIAGMTFAETRRRRILQVIIFLAGLMLVGMLGMTWMAPGEGDKALVSGGLDLVFMLGVLVAVFICAFLIPTDIDKRTIYSVLSKPISRWEFVVGKYFGTMAVIGLLVAVMLLVQMIVLLMATHYPNWKVLEAGAIAYFGIAVFTAAVMAVSTAASSLTTVIAGVVLWVVGSLQSMTHSFVAHLEGGSQIVITFISALVPHLDKYDFRVEAAESMAINPAVLQRGLLHGLAYILVCLVIGSLIFNDRQV